MEKIKWKYYKNCKEWFEQADIQDRLFIKKDNSFKRPFILKADYFKTVGRFRRLSSAKTVANLLRNG